MLRLEISLAIGQFFALPTKACVAGNSKKCLRTLAIGQFSHFPMNWSGGKIIFGKSIKTKDKFFGLATLR